MIRHEIILRIPPDINRESIENTMQEVCHLLVNIPGVERVRFGVNHAAAYRHAMLAVDIVDERALQRFSLHPRHARATRLIAPLAESSAIGSYLITSERR